MQSLSIQPATVHDAPQISALISGVARYFTLHPQGLGAEAFLVSMTADAIAGYIRDEGFHYLVARDRDGVMAGAAALRHDNHLFHLFVSPAWQRQGVATQLWREVLRYAKQQGREGRPFAVNATPYAVPFYERMGFKVSGARVETRGIAFIPMSREADGVDVGACPLCGGPNGCACAQAGRSDVPCWCNQATFSSSLLAQVPDALKGRSCICAACVARQPQTVNTPE
jgi:GNAT superfamily N-acetyltransferase